jgi:hypothetical protein
VHKKSRLIVSVYTKVEKYGLVFRERKTYSRSLSSPGRKPRTVHPFFFDTVLDGVRISKSSRLVAPGVDWRTVLALFSMKSAHVLASSHFLSPSQHDTPLEQTRLRISC